MSLVFDTEEDIDVSSFNHALVQANLARLLGNLGKYTVCTELSLDISNIELNQFDIDNKTEVKPDVCIYLKRGLSVPNDILKMVEMPLLAVEVLSPKQGNYTILEKFKLYFELGIKSCWLVLPNFNTIIVYSTINKHKIFSEGILTDEVLDIQLPIIEIFS